jgi:hypothetical protein
LSLARAESYQWSAFAGGAVPHDDLEACPDKVGGHRTAHDPETEKTVLCHKTAPFHQKSRYLIPLKKGKNKESLSRVP